MEYAKPMLEVVYITGSDIIITSLGDGGTNGEGTGPEVDFGGTDSTQF